MIDFGLLPCPLCDGEAMVEQLTHGPEVLNAVIKCTRCGLTLAWETEFNVNVSRSGKRIVEKVGLDPIEAWNRRHMCDNCGARVLAVQVDKLHDCNDCDAESCPYKPQPGELTRINCPLWRGVEAAE